MERFKTELAKDGGKTDKCVKQGNQRSKLKKKKRQGDERKQYRQWVTEDKYMYLCIFEVNVSANGCMKENQNRQGIKTDEVSKPW